MKKRNLITNRNSLYALLLVTLAVIILIVRLDNKKDLATSQSSTSASLKSASQDDRPPKEVAGDDVIEETKPIEQENTQETMTISQVSTRTIPAAVHEPVPSQPASFVSQPTPQAVAASTPQATASLPLANGNTAGETGTYAAAQMAAATGVSQATWEQIIARESNGQVTAQNASGASGLFQTMPGWGSTATVDDQIAAALNAYQAQGLSAWGY